VQGALNAGPVVTTEAADAGDDIINIFCVYLFGTKDYFPLGKAGFGGAPQVEDYFQQFAVVTSLA